MSEHDIAPPYTPSPSSPKYSREPSPGEETVEFTRRTPSRRPTGVYRRITNLLTIVLRGQYPGNVCPMYGRGEIIQGDVILADIGDLTSVTLKLEGQFLVHASGVPVSTTFLCTTHVLWSASQVERPRTIPLGVTLPLTFDDSGQQRALPPTFQSFKPHTTCSYSLTIELSRPRRLSTFLKGNEAVTVPFKYHPRSRPHLPMLPSDLPFLRTVKSSPEEWHEVICTVPMTQGSGLPPVECLLFIPSVQTFALSDTIPFHLQLRGSPASLTPFLEQDQGAPQSSTRQRKGGIAIRVHLLRRCNARIHGQSITASYDQGEGKMEPSQCLYPSHHASTRQPPGEGWDALGWDGVLRCDKDVTAPSFATLQFSVRDFIVLSITPRQPLKSPVLGVTHSCPIRLVTDPSSSDAVT